jgi:outer membrane receptor protein involved in Fe transport
MKSTSYRLVAFLLLAALLVTSGSVLAQSGQIKGRVVDADTRQPMGGATVMLVGTTLGAVTDQNGNYVIKNVPFGSHTLRALFVGYIQQVRLVVVGLDEIEENFNLIQTVLQQKEVIVEVNRARERETPVAFTTVEKEQIVQRIHGQDAPLLLKGAPGVYAYSTDGVGNGEAKLFVRGFNQNYVQVLINGIPTNDPESNAVYWSNWGSVSSSAASIQVQRGAGSSLYGAGAFGGSFNIITGSPRPKQYYAASLSLGSPMNTMYGVDLSTGLLENSMAFSLKVERKIGEGTRLGARYEGWNYYFSGSWFVNNEACIAWSPAETRLFVQQRYKFLQIFRLQS